MSRADPQHPQVSGTPLAGEVEELVLVRKKTSVSKQQQAFAIGWLKQKAVGSLATIYTLAWVSF